MSDKVLVIGKIKMSDKVLVIRKILKFVSEIWSHENIRSGQSKNGGIVIK